MIPVVQNREEAPGSHDDAGRTVANDVLLQGDSPKLVDDPGQHSGGGVYVGEVLSPIPQKLAKKIIKGDYVEMEELLPELWPTTQQEGEGRTRSQNQKMTDIFIWIAGAQIGWADALSQGNAHFCMFRWEIQPTINPMSQTA